MQDPIPWSRTHFAFFSSWASHGTRSPAATPLSLHWASPPKTHQARWRLPAAKTSSQHFLVGLRSHWQLISCMLMAKPELSTEFLLPNPMCAGHTEQELCKQSPFLSDSGCTLQMHDAVVKEFVTNNPSAQPRGVVLAHAVC